MGGLLGGVLFLIVMHALGCYAAVAFFAAKNRLAEADTVITYRDVPRFTWGLRTMTPAVATPFHAS